MRIRPPLLEDLRRARRKGPFIRPPPPCGSDDGVVLRERGERKLGDRSTQPCRIRLIDGTMGIGSVKYQTGMGRLSSKNAFAEPSEAVPTPCLVAGPWVMDFPPDRATHPAHFGHPGRGCGLVGTRIRLAEGAQSDVGRAWTETRPRAPDGPSGRRARWVILPLRKYHTAIQDFSPKPISRRRDGAWRLRGMAPPR